LQINVFNIYVTDQDRNAWHRQRTLMF